MQDCPEGYEWIHEIPINNYGDEPISTYDCFYQNDINILREIVGINESLMHEPINIGYQSWVNGRIILLDLGYSNIDSIPNNIGNLNNLEWFGLQSNNLYISFILDGNNLTNTCE